MPIITPCFQVEVFNLWNTLAEYPAAHTGDALAHLFAESIRLVNADGARWCMSVRLGTGSLAESDLCSGWRVRDILLAKPTPESVSRLRAYLDGVHKQDPVRVGETTIRALRGGGEFRTMTLRRDVSDFESFRQTRHYELYYQPTGVVDRLWVGCPVNADAESGFVFDRLECSGKPFFSEDDVERAAFILRGMNWFHRRLVLSRGANIGKAPCTAAERRALGLLLTGKSEKEIADDLGLALGTLHSRITTIYRKFGARSRAELMALWL